MTTILSSQPDTLYFLWQLQVQLYNLHQMGLEDHTVILLAGTTPSRLSKQIADATTARVHWIADTRTNKSYVPNIQPHLYAKYFAEHPTTDSVTFIDSDVVFLQAVDLERTTESPTCWGSDTRSYLGYDYVTSKGIEQFHHMCSIVGIDPELVRERDPSTCGAQLIFNQVPSAAFWSKVERDSVTLHSYLNAREHLWTDKANYPIQRWTSGMWALLWNLWRDGYDTRSDAELGFHWATDRYDGEIKYPILHVSGVVPTMRATHFDKTAYVNQHPYADIALQHISEPTNFSHIYSNMLLESKQFWADRGVTT